MKYLVVIAGAVGLGLHWGSDIGWMIALIGGTFIINILIDQEHEQGTNEGAERNQRAD